MHLDTWNTEWLLFKLSAFREMVGRPSLTTEHVEARSTHVDRDQLVVGELGAAVGSRLLAQLQGPEERGYHGPTEHLVLLLCIRR